MKDEYLKDVYTEDVRRRVQEMLLDTTEVPEAAKAYRLQSKSLQRIPLQSPHVHREIIRLGLQGFPLENGDEIILTPLNEVCPKCSSSLERVAVHRKLPIISNFHIWFGNGKFSRDCM